MNGRILFKLTFRTYLLILVWVLVTWCPTIPITSATLAGRHPERSGPVAYTRFAQMPRPDCGSANLRTDGPSGTASPGNQVSLTAPRREEVWT